VAQRGGFRYDAKALRRADPNKRRRWLIPLVLAAQVPSRPPSPPPLRWPPKCSPACGAIWPLVSRTRCLLGCWPLECKPWECGSTGASASPGSVAVRVRSAWPSCAIVVRTGTVSAPAMRGCAPVSECIQGTLGMIPCARAAQLRAGGCSSRPWAAPRVAGQAAVVAQRVATRKG